MHSRYSITGSGLYRRFKRADRSIAISDTSKLHATTDYLRHHGSYAALLFDPRWKERRKEILERDTHQCVICTGKESLQVHHRQYHFVLRDQGFKAPWEYANNLLVTLCERCHKRGHSKYKVPTINI